MLSRWWLLLSKLVWQPRLRIVVTIGCHTRQAEGVGQPQVCHHQFGPKGRFLMAKVQITDFENIEFSVDEQQATQDRRGNPAAPIDPGSEQWFTDNPALLSIDRTDGPNVKVSAVGPLGVANITVKATAGGVPCTGTIEVDIGSDAPAVINVTVGKITKQDDEQPPDGGGDGG